VTHCNVSRKKMRYRQSACLPLDQDHGRGVSLGFAAGRDICTALRCTALHQTPTPVLDLPTERRCCCNPEDGCCERSHSPVQYVRRYSKILERGDSTPEKSVQHTPFELTCRGGNRTTPTPRHPESAFLQSTPKRQIQGP
jgi:hypothetical protein